MKKYRKKLIVISLMMISIMLNIYLFQQLNINKEESRTAQFEKIQNGVNYSYNFGNSLVSNYNDLSLKQKAEYLTSMSWSLQLSVHTLEIVEPNDERYRKLAELFDIYSQLSSSKEFWAMISKKNVIDEESLPLMEILLKDIKYLDENLDYNQLSRMNYTELRTLWESLLANLKYNDEMLDQYKETF
ncbi:hypothetical protein FS935_01360 [Metabacillus litoralis]|uniref:Uncharacterized protein n=1 Tax=Metabacillus litoralis TaxID=152268 RepID=A0A5C6WAF5_9BACI|nr:hypothetical protein [Metabacillus litoralis]TXC92869.1 hypothetical protein FS935_01360 [Metabacillus litoralis]